jgi:2-hydroxychromene-2-carboxylate isomerase
MSLSVDVHWSFRSPYSYLVTSRLIEVEQRYDVMFRIRPVLPIAVRIDGFFDQVNPLWPLYVFRDSSRLAESMGIPFRWPRPDPIVQTRDEATGRMKTAADQPYIYRLTRAGQLASEEGKGLPFVAEISSLIFGGTENWHEGDQLARAAERAGCDMASLDARAIVESGRIDSAIEANQAALEAAGHWGVPTMVFAGEAFFGQDRLDLLLWRLRQHGLQER